MWHIRPSKKTRRFVIANLAIGAMYYVLYAAFTRYFHLWYVPTIVIASIIHSSVKFGFHKWWAFENHEVSRVHHQGMWYALVEAASIFVNVHASRFLIEHYHLWDIGVQLVLAIPLGGIGLLASGRIFAAKNSA